jgi:hypothetical protein
MKKLALILALMIIPCTAFGLEMLTDNNLDAITGQDGVSITADDIQLFLNVDLFAYADTDGYDLHNGCAATGCSNGAMIAVQNFQMDVININAILATAQTGTMIPAAYATSYNATTHNLPLVSANCGIPLFYNYASTAPFSSCISSCVFAANTNITHPGLPTANARTTKGLDHYTPQTFFYDGTAVARKYIPQALSIDVTDNLPLLSQAYNYIIPSFGGSLKVQGIIITLPTLEIYIQDINMEVAMYDLDCQTTVLNGGNFGGTASTKNRFGEIMIQGVTFSILSGWVEIAPH